MGIRMLIQVMYVLLILIQLIALQNLIKQIHNNQMQPLLPPPSNPYDNFVSKLPSYRNLNYYILILSSIQLFLMISVIPSQMLCHQGLPIVIYNIVAESLTIPVVIACVFSSKELKYFNSVLAFMVLIYFVKVVQIFTLTLFRNVGTCQLELLYRLPVVIFLVIQLVTLVISGWILKRVRRVDREYKALGVSQNKRFLSD